MHRLGFSSPTQVNQNLCIPIQQTLLEGVRGTQPSPEFGGLGVAPQGSETQIVAKTNRSLMNFLLPWLG
jgi:hypothetical protein